MCPNIDNSSINKHSSPCTNMTIKHNDKTLLIATVSSRFSSLEFNVEQEIVPLHTPPFECKRIIMANKKRLKGKTMILLNIFFMHLMNLKSVSSVFHLESQTYLPMVGTMNISTEFKIVDPLPAIL